LERLYNHLTYDENGGRWDHVIPPVRPDGWGVGVRVPTIIISPFARRGYVDSLVMILGKVAKTKHVAKTALLAGLAGCSPMTEIAGSYFPAWLLCMLAGLIMTLL
jgi:hypothetical protein